MNEDGCSIVNPPRPTKRNPQMFQVHLKPESATMGRGNAMFPACAKQKLCVWNVCVSDLSVL